MIGNRDVGSLLLRNLGESGARKLLDILEGPEADRAAGISHIAGRHQKQWLYELTIDLERDDGEVIRLRVIDELKAALPSVADVNDEIIE